MRFRCVAVKAVVNQHVIDTGTETGTPLYIHTTNRDLFNFACSLKRIFILKTKSKTNCRPNREQVDIERRQTRQDNMTKIQLMKQTVTIQIDREIESTFQLIMKTNTQIEGSTDLTPVRTNGNAFK